jgi:hypothetical protein
MSYDIYLLSPELPVKQALAFLRSQSDQHALAEAFAMSNPGKPNPRKEARKNALATALQRINPELRPFAFDYTAIASMMEVSEEEARTRWRHIELNSAPKGYGTQITLYDDYVSIAVPYWHSNDRAEQALRQVWAYVDAMITLEGYVAFDPQLDRVLDTNADLPSALSQYARGYLATQQAAARLAKRRRPWWRVW